ncbi:diguanylate cyclase [Christensenellaceae bacterium OttesenSCG-928-K19]|nr:diguanylate cyclase [Christensenellaceae bacterium OttesenSCG-928-K19]
MVLSKAKREQVEQFLSGILDVQDAEIIIVRGNDCKVLFTNASLRGRLKAEVKSERNCKTGYASLFPSLCKHCPNCNTDSPYGSATFDTRDEQGRFFSVTASTIDWLDDKPAVLLLFRDVHEEREAQDKLFNLAYIDQLTGVPNRQKLKEDFNQIHNGIIENKKCGAVGIFDLDNFKAINDTYGHNTGDVLLRRITEHLSSDEAFRGHLYRLGGDEFVLLYHENEGTFENPEALQEHYRTLMQSAFLSYTMPTIDKACTLSMGLSFFPEHGSTYSELLRKADIALYKAKTAGRNQLAFFEDQYDTAEKFKDVFINIQPILNASGGTFGYELIDRSHNDDKEESENSINLTEFDRTMDALGLGDIENDARYLISFSKQLLSPSVLKNLPKNKFIIQVNADDVITPKGRAIYEQLRKHGYSLALEGINGQNFSADLINMAGYCKFEPDGISDYNLTKIIASNPKKVFIGTGVDTIEDFNNAKKRGFKLFQGFFFEQPPVVTKKDKDIDPLKVNYLRLIQLTSTDDYVDFREISNIISSDVALSYKLLRLLNSAALGLRNKISSITTAVAYLGEESLKKWIAMLALRGIGSDKPLELIRVSMIRARFGELLAPHFRIKRDSKHVFLVGLLSLLHIAVEKSKEELFQELPVAEDISESILTKNGVHSDLLSFFSNYEYSNWDEVSRFAKENHLSSELINDCYIDAVKWYNDLADNSE